VSPSSSDTAGALAGDDPTLTPQPGAVTDTRETDGLPLWVPGVGVVGLMAAAGGIAWWRRPRIG
jgi:hypothetical protein